MNDVISQNLINLTKNFNDKLLKQNKHFLNASKHNASETRQIINSINETNTYNNLQRWDLPEDRRFAGNPKTLLHFVRHITNKVFQIFPQRRYAGNALLEIFQVQSYQ